MRKFVFILTALSFCITGILAQAPLQFNYQAVLRDSNGTLMPNESVTADVSILQGAPDGTVVFTEQHSVTTSDLGLMSLQIGSSSDLGVVDWGSDIYFIEISVNGNKLGSSQILSVPYALYAEQTGTWRKNESSLYYNGGNVGIGTAEPTAHLHILEADHAWFKIGTTLPNKWVISDMKAPGSQLQFSILGSEAPGGGVILAGTANVDAIAPGGLNIINEDSSYIAFFTKGYHPEHEKMRITAEGKVGIGTTEPDAELHILDEDHAWFRLGTSSANKWAIADMKAPGSQLQFSVVGEEAIGGGVILAGTANVDAIAPGGLNIINEDSSYVAFLTNGYHPEHEKMRITAEGKVGIGTTEPTAHLHIFDDKPAWLEIETSAASKWAVADMKAPGAQLQFLLMGNETPGGGAITGSTANVDAIAANGLNIINEENSHIAFLTNGYQPSDEKMRLNSDGKLGVGTTEPNELLEVSGAIKVSDGGYSGITDGATGPVPAGGAGTIIFLGTHFFGWDGSAWQQLD
jgi:hypothetical protein